MSIRNRNKKKKFVGIVKREEFSSFNKYLWAYYNWSIINQNKLGGK